MLSILTLLYYYKSCSSLFGFCYLLNLIYIKKENRRQLVLQELHDCLERIEEVQSTGSNEDELVEGEGEDGMKRDGKERTDGKDRHGIEEQG